MSELKILSVAEDNGNSERMSAVQHFPGRMNEPGTTIVFSIYSDRSLHIRFNAPLPVDIIFPELDVDGLILFLQDAKQFISESDVIAKLQGKKR